MIIERKHCTKCKTTDDLIIYVKNTNKAGVTYVYYMCRPCNAERKRKWYHNGNQAKALSYNHRYQINKQMNQ